MSTSIMLTAFLLPGVLVAYWAVTDWLKERALRRQWVMEPLLSDGIRRPRRSNVRHATAVRRNRVME